MRKLRILFFYSDFFKYPMQKAFRQALARVANVKFVCIQRCLINFNDPMPRTLKFVFGHENRWRDASNLANKYKADVVVIGLWNENFKYVRNLRKVKAVKVMSCGDPHGHAPKQVSYINANKIDVVYTSQVPKFKRQIKHPCRVLYFCPPVDINLFKDYGLERKWDVFCTGSSKAHTMKELPKWWTIPETLRKKHRIYPLRLKIQLLAKQPNIKANLKFGFPYTLQNYAKALSQSKILIFDNGLFKYLSARFPQGMASKTLVLAPMPIPMCAEKYHLKTGYNFVEINKNNFLEKVRYYLSHENERKKIVENAYQTILKYHTSDIRAKEFVALMERIINEKKNLV